MASEVVWGVQYVKGLFMASEVMWVCLRASEVVWGVQYGEGFVYGK